MTLTTKKSRRVEIDNVGYRYQVSTTMIDDNWNFSLNLTLQSEVDRGRVLKAKGLVTRDYWLDFSDAKADLNQGDYPIILPRHIAKFVKPAMVNGWNPTENGKPFVLNVDNGTFFNE